MMPMKNEMKQSSRYLKMRKNYWNNRPVPQSFSCVLCFFLPQASFRLKNTSVDPLEMHAKKHIQVLRQRLMIVEHDGVCHAHFLMQRYSSL